MITRSISTASLRRERRRPTCCLRLQELQPFAAPRAKVNSARKQAGEAAAFGENADRTGAVRLFVRFYDLTLPQITVRNRRFRF